MSRFKSSSRVGWTAAGLVLCATALLERSATAEVVSTDQPASSTRTARPLAFASDGQAPPASSTGAPIGITREQFEAFVQLTGDPKPDVWQRLQLDPSLVPLAAAAGEARLERRSSGKVRTIVGFTIFGVGMAAGYVVFLATLADSTNCNNYGYESSCSDKDVSKGLWTAVIIWVAFVGVGLGIGILGIISMVKQSEMETAVMDRYQYGRNALPPALYPSQSMARPARAFRVPILSITF